MLLKLVLPHHWGKEKFLKLIPWGLKNRSFRGNSLKLGVIQKILLANEMVQTKGLGLVRERSFCKPYEEICKDLVPT